MLPLLSLVIKGIGAYFAIEGAGNIVYWYLFGGGVADNNFWQIGRFIRMVLCLILVVYG
jgi:hypothetical protein